jgi:hypothetical protein
MAANDIESKKILLWNKAGVDIPVRSLEDLFEVLMGIQAGDVDNEVGQNISKSQNKLLAWLETNFPRQSELILHVRSLFLEKEVFTPQQVREQILRDLRISLKKS